MKFRRRGITQQKEYKLPINTLGTFPSKPITFRKRVRKVISKVKWSEVNRSEEEIEYIEEKGLKCIREVKWREGIVKYAGNRVACFQEHGSESDIWSEVKWRELKWGEDQLNAVKGREWRRSWMWSVYNGSEVDCGVGLGETCENDYCIVWFIHCLVYLVYLVVPSGF